MENSDTSTPANTSDQENNYSPHTQVIVGMSVIFLFILAGFFVYLFMKGNISKQPTTSGNVLNASTKQINPIQNVNATPYTVTNSENVITPSTQNSTIPSGITCSRYGPAQKWEYLEPYTVKDGDSLQSIASTQLNDPSRVNEILQINGQGPYEVGSTLYLPPPSITKSTGNIEEVYGLLTEKDSSYWKISYSSDPNGMGILMPSYWFDTISNSNSFSVGNCVKVLFDNGNKAFSVSTQ